MVFEQTYLEMCRLSGHRKFEPTRALFQQTDKKLAKLEEASIELDELILLNTAKYLQERK